MDYYSGRGNIKMTLCKNYIKWIAIGTDENISFVETLYWLEPTSNFLRIEGLDLAWSHLNLYEDSTRNKIYQFKKQISRSSSARY